MFSFITARKLSAVCSTSLKPVCSEMAVDHHVLPPIHIKSFNLRMKTFHHEGLTPPLVTIPHPTGVLPSSVSMEH